MNHQTISVTVADGGQLYHRESDADFEELVGQYKQQGYVTSQHAQGLLWAGRLAQPNGGELYAYVTTMEVQQS